MPRTLLMIARFALGVTPRALIGNFCVGSAILLPFADSMLPNGASIVAISDSDDQNDGETCGGHLAIFGPAILGSVLVVGIPTLVASIESPGDPLIFHLFTAAVPHPRGPPPCSADRETQLHPPTVPLEDSLSERVQPFGWTAPVAFAANFSEQARRTAVYRDRGDGDLRYRTAACRRPGVAPLGFN
jgi:hypothetical protein